MKPFFVIFLLLLMGSIDSFLCDGGCAYHRYRNMFEDCHYELCSSYKDLETLKYALLNGEFQSQIQG